MCATERASLLRGVSQPMRVSLHFPRPGFFLGDFSVEALVDGELVHRGSFVGGFLVERDLAPGTHTVETRIGVGLFTRKRSYVLEVPPEGEGIVATLEYSRTWGNFVERLAVREGTLDALPAPPVVDEVEVPSVPVRATWIVLAVLVVVFALELALGVSPADGASPSIQTLSAMGGLGASAIADRELHRLLTATLLHADPIHLVLNAVSLVLAGAIVERKLGAAWFFVVYTVSAIGGSLVSIAMNRGDIISIGASGAVLGIFAAGMVLANAYPAAHRAGLRLNLARVLVPSLVFPLFERHGQPVDMGAHIGGAIAGALMGLVLLRPLTASARAGTSFARSRLGIALAVASVVATLGATAVVVARTYPRTRALAAIEATIYSNEERPAEPATAAQWDALRKKYPNDPRVLLHDGDLALERRDGAELDRAIREGRAAVSRTAPAFTPEAVESFGKMFDALEADKGLLALAPEAELPKETGEAAARAWNEKLPALLAKYPKDPRIHEENAFRMYGKVEPVRVLEEIRLARSLAPAVARHFPNGLDQRELFALEAIVLADQGKKDESARLAARLCAGEEGDSAKRIVTSARMCGAAPPR